MHLHTSLELLVYLLHLLSEVSLPMGLRRRTDLDRGFVGSLVLLEIGLRLTQKLGDGGHIGRAVGLIAHLILYGPTDGGHLGVSGLEDGVGLLQLQTSAFGRHCTRDSFRL
jgi:hypothetical protein